MKITRYFKAFALSGRLADCYYTQGDCPGLGASALSGRVEQLNQFRFYKSAAKIHFLIETAKEF